MASLTPSPRFQFIYSDGEPLFLGKLYTYAAGTDVPLATYTSSTGNTQNTNPVVLDAYGSAAVWLGSSLYKMVLKDRNDSTIYTVDNVGGIATQSDLAAVYAAFAASSGSTLVGYISPGSGAVARTVGSKLAEGAISIADFGASVSQTASFNTTAITLAANQAALLGKALYIPGVATYYPINDSVVLPANLRVYGDGYTSCIRQTAAGKNGLVLNTGTWVEGIRTVGPGVGVIVDATKDNGFYAIGKHNARVTRCFTSNWDFSGIQFTNCTDFRISENLCQLNLYSSGTGADIICYSDTLGERGVINDNFCLSNNSQGIYVNALGNDLDVVISRNVCATLDANFDLVTSGNLLRRHGIISGYNGGGVGGDINIIENLCINTRQTGIYYQGATAPTHSTSITKNIIRRVGVNAVDPTLAGGIFIATQAPGDLVEGNLIDSMAQTGRFVSGGIVLAINSGMPVDNKTTLRNNTVMNSAANGMYITGSPVNIEVDGFTFNGVTDEGVQFVPTAAYAGSPTIKFKNITGRNMLTANRAGLMIDHQACNAFIEVDTVDVVGLSSSAATVYNAGVVWRLWAKQGKMSNIKARTFYAAIGSDTYLNSRTAVRVRDVYAQDCNSVTQIGTSNSAGVLVVEGIERAGSTAIDFASNVLAGTLAVYAGMYTSSTQAQIILAAAPTTGTWVIGDRTQMSTPVVGQPKAWSCTVAGSPGTWVSEGNL